MVAGASYFTSPCIRASVAAGAITDIGSFNTGYSPTSALFQATQAVLGGQWDDASFGGKKVMLAEDEEKSALGVSEYGVYVAALFNDEALAASTFNSQVARYSCTAAAGRAAAAAAPAPRVLWGSPFPLFPAADRVWYVAGCPNWYCGLVGDAGGELLLSAAGTALSDADFAALAKQADVFVYTGIDWASGPAAYLPGASAAQPATGADAALTSILASMPAVASGRVYDIQGSAGGSAWFQLRPLNFDALLQELTRIVQPIGAAAAGFSLPRGTPNTFLRNIFTTPVIPALPAASTCPAGVTAQPASLLSLACPMSSSPAALPLSAMPGAIAGIAIGLAALAGVAALVVLKGAAAAGGAAKAAPAVVSSTPATVEV